MKNVSARLLFPALALLGLGGCQVFAPASQGPVALSVSDADFSTYFAQMLAQGRAHLLANRPGAALVSFRRAAYDPASRAAAYNGTAIAYDRLGRADLAQQYFIAAIELDPENGSFAANLDRFSGTRLAAAAEALHLAEARSPSAPLGQSNPAAAGSVAANGPMQRVSSREVHLNANPASASTSQEVLLAAAGRPAEVNVERRARGSAERSNGTYPVRVVLNAGRGQRGAATVSVEPRSATRRNRTPLAFGPRSQLYPVRVALDES